MKKQTPNKWELILADKTAPPELHAEARAKLGLAAPQHSFDYSPELDFIVESYTGVRWSNEPEAEESMNHNAVIACHALNGFCVLGGHLDSAKNEADAEVVLAVLGRCKSEWMKARCLAALRTVLDLPLHGVPIAPELKLRIEDALA